MTKRSRPSQRTAEQVQWIRDAWTIRLLDVRAIAEETGLHRATVLAEIRRHRFWSAERLKRQQAHDVELSVLGAECTRLEMRAARAVASALAIGAEKAERFFAKASDDEAVAKLGKLPSLRDMAHVERVNTGRPVAGPPAPPPTGADKELSLLDRLRAAGCRTVPFPGDEAEAATAAAPDPPGPDGRPLGEA